MRPAWPEPGNRTTITVPVPVDEARRALLDVERVAHRLVLSSRSTLRTIGVPVTKRAVVAVVGVAPTQM